MWGKPQFVVESGLCHQTSPPWQGKPALCTAVAHGQANILKPLGLPTVVQVWASTEFGQTLLRGTDKIYMHIIFYLLIYLLFYSFFVYLYNIYAINIYSIYTKINIINVCSIYHQDLTSGCAHY